MANATPLSPDARHELEIEAQATPGKPPLTRSRPMLAGPLRNFSLSGLLADPLRGLPNPDDLSYSIYNRLRHDPTVSHGLLLLKAPILGRVRQAVVECEDPSIRRVIEHEFLERGLLSRIVERELRALDFGAFFGEKEWQVYDRELSYTTTDAGGEETEASAWQGPLLTLADVREVNPEDVTEVRLRTQDRDGKPGDGSFDGFRCRVQGEASPVDVVVQKAFVFTHRPEFGNYWGEPRIKPAYPFYFWKQVDLKLEHALGERKVSPNRVIRYPEGVDTETGEDNQTVALSFGEAIDAQVAIALPSEVDASGKYRWDVEEKTLSDRTNVFSALIQQDDDQMLRAIGVPARAFLEGQYGTKAEAEAHTDTLLMSLDELLYACLDAVNDYAVGPVVLVNFGADAPRARIRVPGLTDDERAFRKQAALMLLANPAVQARIDLEQLLEHDFALPLTDAQENAPGAAPAAPQGLSPAETGSPATQPETAPPAPSEGLPANLVLTDLDDDEQADLLALLLADDDVTLAEAFDPGVYEITPDPKASNGYKVVSRRSGKRLSGFAANQVLKGYFSYAKKQAAAAQREAAKQQRAAAAEQKRQQRAAETASRKAEREALKQQKAAERAAAKQQRDQQRAQRQQQREQAAAQREADRTAREQQRAASEADRARASVVSGERQQIEHEARSNPRTAMTALAAKGYSQVGSASDREAAREQARSLASRDPQSLYTVVQVGDQFVIARKPKQAVDRQVQHQATTPANVVASDAEPEVFGLVPEPTPETPLSGDAEEEDDLDDDEDLDEDEPDEDDEEDEDLELHDVPAHAALWRQAEARLREFFAPAGETGEASTGAEGEGA